MQTNAYANRTPGDWTLEYDGSLVMAGQVIDVSNLGPDTASRSEKKANARLMAAAPKLAAALKGLVAFIDCLDRTHCGLADFADLHPDLENDYPAAIEALRAIGVEPFEER